MASNCSVSATDIQFGSYSGVTINVTGTITVRCSGNVNYEVGIDAGTGIGATVTNRSMTGPGSVQFGYGLFRDAARSLNWGNTAGIDTVSGIGGGGPKTITIYAQLPINQYAPANLYTDPTVTVYVTAPGVNTATATFSVMGTVAKACIISASSLNFGVYSGTLIKTTSVIAVTCTSTTPYDVGLNAGNASGATETNRSMTGPNSILLGYNLFRDSNYTLNWGNTVGVDTKTGTGAGIVQSLTVYGQMPAGQTGQPPGNYSDTITATITY